LAAPKRSKAQREADLARIAHLYLSGSNQYEIAKELGLSRQQITYDLQDLYGRWAESARSDIDKLKAEQLAKIDRLEREYWDAWRRSVGTHEKSITERKRGETQMDRAQIVKEELAGDPRFLTGVGWCIEQRCKILGLNAPQKVAPTDPSGENPYMNMTDEELRAVAMGIAGDNDGSE